MRIVTGTISHETNTFSNIPTDLNEFAKQGLTLGQDVSKRFAGTNSVEAADILRQANLITADSLDDAAAKAVAAALAVGGGA